MNALNWLHAAALLPFCDASSRLITFCSFDVKLLASPAERSRPENTAMRLLSSSAAVSVTAPGGVNTWMYVRRGGCGIVGATSRVNLAIDDAAHEAVSRPGNRGADGPGVCNGVKDRGVRRRAGGRRPANGIEPSVDDGAGAVLLSSWHGCLRRPRVRGGVVRFNGH